jgi:uncharacterized protein YqeY
MSELMAPLKAKIQEQMKEAMRAKDAKRLGVIRLILAALKQKEVDERIDLKDSDILAILEKMLKQRRESIEQFEKAARHDLSEQEHFEVKIVQEFMPEPLSEHEVENLIKEAITQANASSIKEMGKVMEHLRPKVQGRADMGKVSQKIKSLLSA